MKTEAESSLENYIEIYFKKIDNQNIFINDDYDDEISSQYSTLSSILGIQVIKPLCLLYLQIDIVLINFSLSLQS